MTFKFSCPSCGQRIAAETAAGGKKSKCPNCGNSLVVPTDVAELYVMQDSEQTGPFSEDQAKNLIILGRLRLTDLAWRPGRVDWIPVGMLLGFGLSGPSQALAPVPPPGSKLWRRFTPVVIAWGTFAIVTVVFFAVDDWQQSVLKEIKRTNAYANERWSKDYAAWKMLEAAASPNPLSVIEQASEEQRAVRFRLTELAATNERAETWTTLGLISWWAALITAIVIQTRAILRKRRTTK